MTTIDYYFAPVSPWAYLGHARFVQIAKAAGARVQVKPMDLGAVFPISGGLPLPKRAPQRQAYRLVELKRFSEHLGIPLNVQPKHFPAPGDEAAKLILAADQLAGTDAALDLAHRIGRAIWAEERAIGDPAVLQAIGGEAGLDKAVIDCAADPAIAERYAACTQQAIDAGVFGAPSYVIDGELFWGQDRLDFVQRRLCG